jgi:hypothetical protein
VSLHEIVTHPVFLSFWGAFSIDFWHWAKADGWSLSAWDWNIATKRWALGIVTGILAWQGLGRL